MTVTPPGITSTGAEPVGTATAFGSTSVTTTAGTAANPDQEPRPTEPRSTEPRRGLFVAFEGGEGVGKSTQARLLAEALRADGHDVVVTREPGGSPRAERIRQLILAEDSATLDPRTEALLFAAARADHAAQLLRPALERGAVVISDRYLDSSVAYQGVARELGADWIRQLSLWATASLVPDLTVVLDLDVSAGLARAQDRNRLEGESPAFHMAVRQAFLDMAAHDPDRYVVLSAAAPAEDVAEHVSARVIRLLDAAW